MIHGTGLGMAIVLAAASPPQPPPPPGASSCSGCHGAVSPIAGRDEKDLTEALVAFQSGARTSTMMGRIARGFSVEELRAIAMWWAARK
jgi:sulfide dehydrogenase cytochrome subunit